MTEGKYQIWKTSTKTRQISNFTQTPLGLSSFKKKKTTTKNVLKHEKEAYEHSIPYTCHCYFQLSLKLQKTALTESRIVLLCVSNESS